MDIEKAKSYYNQIRSEDLCDCDYCRNNIHEVKAAYSTFFIGTNVSSFTHDAESALFIVSTEIPKMSDIC